jgi:hypothetical protein
MSTFKLFWNSCRRESRQANWSGLPRLFLAVQGFFGDTWNGIRSSLCVYRFLSRSVSHNQTPANCALANVVLMVVLWRQRMFPSMYYLASASFASVNSGPCAHSTGVVDFVKFSIRYLGKNLRIFIPSHSSPPKQVIVPHGWEREHESGSTAGNPGLYVES